MAHEPSQITILLKAWRGGDAQALERLTPLVYDHLRRMAAGYVVKERVDRQMNATALVHEAYLKLVDAPSVELAGPGAFLRHCRPHHATHPG